MKKILFALCVLLFVVLLIPRHGAAEAPSSTPVPDALVAEALAAKQASYPAWVGDEVGFLSDQELSMEDQSVATHAPETLDDWTGVVLQKYVDGNWEIFKFQGLGGSYPIPKTQLTFNPGSDVFPRYNGDATQIAFASNRDGNYEIYLMDSNGGSLNRLTNNVATDSQPQWSKVSDRIVFVTDRDGNTEIYGMNSDGSGETRLTNNSVGDVYPTISPNGSQIAWLQTTSYGASVWLMNADGSGQHPISPWYPYAQHLTWSPDGEWLAWDGDFSGDGWNEIIRVKPNGTELQLLSLPTDCVCELWVSSWAPDSQKVLSTFQLYQFIYDELTIYSSTPNLFYLNGNPSTIFDYPSSYDINFDRNYDAVTLDSQPPVSQIEALPFYTRANAFLVSWQGKDFGLSGLLNIGVQYKQLSSETWMDWILLAFSGSEVFSGNPGETYYFRSQALDNADNIEPWPSGEGDTFTTLYTSFAAGKVTDSRGVPLSLLSLNLNPLPVNSPIQTNLAGDFTAYLTTYMTETLALASTGYGTFPNTSINAQNDFVSDYYLPPVENLIQNGGFEDDPEIFSHWEITGTVPITFGVAHSGQNALYLGQECFVSCIVTSTVVGPAVFLEDATLIADRHEGLHLVSDSLQYYRWTIQDGWSQGFQFGSDFNVEGIGTRVIQDKQDNLHVTWDYFPSNGSISTVYYARRQPNGQWDTAQAIVSGGYESKIASDSNGVIHLVYLATINSSTTGLFYMTRSLSGAWSEPILLAEDYYLYTPLIMADNSNNIHIFYNQKIYSGNEQSLLRQITLAENGTKLSEKIVTSQLSGYTLFQDAIGRIYLILKFYDNFVWYKVLDTEGVWSNLEPLTDFPLISNNLVVDSKGRIHMIGKYGGDDYYVQKDPESGRGTMVRFYVAEANAYSNFSIAIDNNDFLHVAWGSGSEIRHATPPTTPQNGYASLSQTITIPAELHKPTISFMHQLVGDAPWSASGYTLSVTHGPTTTQVLSSTTTAETWTLDWADMSQWAGQTVTITFTLHQAANEPYVRFLVDDVSLGSWLTPVPTSVDIPHIPLPTGPVQITITGENFIEGATVALNDISLENVQWIDEHTLLATVPANIPPGRYNLWVTNPGGQASVLAGAVIAGQEVFLPIVVH